MERTYLEVGKRGRNLYENISSDEIINTSNNLADKVRGVFGGAVKKASLYGTVALVLGYLAVGYSNDARAQLVCGPHQSISEELKKKYTEVPISMGITSGGGIIEVYESKKDNTWTLVITQPNGRSCLIAAGNDWMDLHKDIVKAKGPEI